MSPSNHQEVCFQIYGRKLAAKRWNAGATHKVIALHGWLDNCASFDPMAEHFVDVDLVALDLAGHGKSDFRSVDSQYLIWSEVAEIFSVADQLEWDCFILLGHSRGAGIAAISAGTFPERIQKLALIEGGVPLPLDVNEAPQNLASHILDDAKLAGTKGSLFDSREKAISARANGFTKITEASAEILAIRALHEEEAGFRWHADPRLKAPSGLKLTNGQIQAFLSRISAPSLLIMGDRGILHTMPFMAKHTENIEQLERIELPGRHHLHMEESAAACATAVENFLNS